MVRALHRRNKCANPLTAAVADDAAGVASALASAASGTFATSAKGIYHAPAGVVAASGAASAGAPLACVLSSRTSIFSHLFPRWLPGYQQTHHLQINHAGIMFPPL